MYEYTFETITTSAIGGQISSYLSRTANAKAEEGWRLIQIVTQYTEKGTINFVYLAFERTKSGRFFRSKSTKK